MSEVDPAMEQLIAAALADRLPAAERATLSQAVATDPAVAAALARACWIDEGLHQIFNAAPAAAGDSVSARLRNAGHRPAARRTRRRDHRRRSTTAWWWTAAAAAVAIVPLMLFWPVGQAPVTSAGPTGLVARIEAESASLHIDDGPARRSAALYGDETIRSSGPARLSADGLSLACTGGSRFRLVSLRGPAAASRIDLLHGQLTCAVDHRQRSGAVVIATPAATVRVTGTRFRVSHEATTGTAVQVETGRVLVESAGQHHALAAGENFTSQPASPVNDDEAEAAVTRPRRWQGTFTTPPDAATVKGDWHEAEGGFLRGVPGRTGVQQDGRSFPTRNVRLLAIADETLTAGPGLRLRLRTRVSHAMHCNVMLALENGEGEWQGNVMAYPQLTEAWGEIELSWEDFKELATAAEVTDLTGTTIATVVVQIVGGKVGAELDVASITIVTR